MEKIVIGHSIVLEDYKVSTHSLWCFDGPESFLLDSVSLWKTTMSVYTLPGAFMVQDPSYVTQ